MMTVFGPATLTGIAVQLMLHGNMFPPAYAK
jgi:hypothetical protein